MILPLTKVPEGLRSWLIEASDRGPLIIRETPAGPDLVHKDGSELDSDEQVEVEALLAAHEAEPLTLRRKK